MEQHTAFSGSYIPNDSEGIFASANSKVCFEPPEIFSVALNSRLPVGVFAPKSLNIKDGQSWKRKTESIKEAGNQNLIR